MFRGALKALVSPLFRIKTRRQAGLPPGAISWLVGYECSCGVRCFCCFCFLAEKCRVQTPRLALSASDVKVEAFGDSVTVVAIRSGTGSRGGGWFYGWINSDNLTGELAGARPLGRLSVSWAVPTKKTLTGALSIGGGRRFGGKSRKKGIVALAAASPGGCRVVLCSRPPSGLPACIFLPHISGSVFLPPRLASPAASSPASHCCRGGEGDGLGSAAAGWEGWGWKRARRRVVRSNPRSFGC